MPLVNLKRILKNANGLDAWKFILLTASYTRPKFRKVCDLLVQPFIHGGEIEIDFKCLGRKYRSFIRRTQQQSDLFTVSEIALGSSYNLPPSFAPDFVLDGGGNIGLFTLYASAIYPAARIVVCEPVPDNITQIKKHLGANHISAEVQPVCIGGSHRTIPFYIRHANAGSFDSSKPYTSQMDIEVLTLSELLGRVDANRIFIKLDIEGMEIEALESYVPEENRAVMVVGELHRHRETRQHLERIFNTNGWSVRCGDSTGDDLIFEAYSPAAQQQLN